MVSFEIFVKAMPPSLSELKVLPSFCFSFKIPDNVAASNLYVCLDVIANLDSNGNTEWWRSFDVRCISKPTSNIFFPSKDESAKKQKACSEFFLWSVVSSFIYRCYSSWPWCAHLPLSWEARAHVVAQGTLCVASVGRNSIEKESVYSPKRRRKNY